MSTNKHANLPKNNCDDYQTEESVRRLRIMPSLYKGKGKEGDFALIPKQERRLNCLWLFTDTILCRFNGKKGGGCACLRPWAYGNTDGNEQPLACAVYVGWDPYTGGFNNFHTDRLAKLAIDSGFTMLRILLDKYPHIDTLYYPADKTNSQMLGVDLFANTSCPENLIYISKKIHELAILKKKVPPAPSKLTETLLIQRASRECEHSQQIREYKNKVTNLQSILVKNSKQGPKREALSTTPERTAQQPKKAKFDIPTSTNSTSKPTHPNNIDRYVGFGRTYSQEKSAFEKKIQM